MATIRRIGFGTVFELEDSKVGIGTDAATHTLQALGNIRSEDATVTGVSSLTTYQGFVNKEARFTKGQIDIESQSGSTSGEIVIDGDVTVSSATTFTSGPQHLTVTDTFTLPSGDTNSRTLKPTIGSLRFNQDFATLEFYTGNNWATVNTFTDIKTNPQGRGRGVVMGGTLGVTPYLSDIEFFNIATRGNSQNFGNLTATRRTSGGCSSSTRGLIGGGSSHPSGNTDIIEYITIASEGDSIDFGNLTSTREHPSGSSSSSTRGLWAGGHPNTNIIEYVEISTLGNALDFGDCMSAQHAKGVCSSPTRAVIAEGTDGSNPNSDSLVSFITISSKGNAVRFGELTYNCHYPNSSSNQVRGVFCMGYDTPAYSYDLNYVTIASEGNAIDFGEASHNGYNGQGCASGTRAMTGIGGYDSSNYYNVIEFVEIATLGNPLDFGDLSQKKYLMAVVSDCHGGLGGF
tara:strand:- start:19 stop:1395 length:1377 start_codon:yes stop_codon:yes gene_type:complete